VRSQFREANSAQPCIPEPVNATYNILIHPHTTSNATTPAPEPAVQAVVTRLQDRLGDCAGVGAATLLPCLLPGGAASEADGYPLGASDPGASDFGASDPGGEGAAGRGGSNSRISLRSGGFGGYGSSVRASSLSTVSGCCQADRCAARLLQVRVQRSARLIT
jgi:hypothetical protein